MTDTISAGKQVTLHFTLKLDSEDVIDSTCHKQPATCVIGDGNFLPGFEAVLLGLKVGDQRSFVIKSEHAFGFHRDENVHHVPRAQFDPRVVLTKGLIMDFADGKATLPGVVVDILEESVIVDFNHPLSGRDIIFEVEIVAVNDVSSSVIPVTQL